MMIKKAILFLFVGFCVLNLAACSTKSQQEIDAES